jgi:hypothetical protein
MGTERYRFRIVVKPLRRPCFGSILTGLVTGSTTHKSGTLSSRASSRFFSPGRMISFLLPANISGCSAGFGTSASAGINFFPTGGKQERSERQRTDLQSGASGIPSSRRGKFPFPVKTRKLSKSDSLLPRFPVVILLLLLLLISSQRLRHTLAKFAT